MQEIVTELGSALAQVDDTQMSSLVATIDAHRRVFVYGTGRSGLMLKSFAMRLMQIGYTAFVIGETTTPSVQLGDVLIVASASGSTDSVVNAAKGAVGQGIDVIAISGAGPNELSMVVPPLICLDVATKFKESVASVQPLGSLFEQMLLIIFDGAILRMSRGSTKTNKAMAARHASIE
ncbi:3-hydroxy-3-methylglutaryl CoA synthase [Olsenella sp. HMSC062G07]|nr:3-hydroxy-3-methylglutaryl CoA synthase [Olsenella sp. HMSC062G07]